MSLPRCRRFLLRLAAVFVFVFAVYHAADLWTLRSWNDEDSLIVEVLEMGTERLRPTAVSKDEEAEEESFPALDRPLKVLVLTGKQKGRAFNIVVTRLAGSGVDLLPNRRYLLMEDVFEDGGKQYSIADSYRIPSVLAFVAFVSALLLLFAGWDGLRALLGLGISVVCLLWGLVPLIASGWPP
ncbi:MAG: hypothetical protein Q4A13_06510, partial [Fretibacterium sp.]|nr:hypothetical protein [Fretibacterium sp.]